MAPVKLALAPQQTPPAAGLVALDRASPELGVDGHLLAGHGVEDEARAHFGHALGAFGDDEELDRREHEEDHRAADVVAPDDHLSELLDHLAGVGLRQDEARRGDVEREAQQRREQQERQEGGDADGVGDVEDDEENRDGDRQIRRQQHVEHPRGQRHDHQADDEDDERRERNVGRGEPAARASVRRHGCEEAVHAADPNAARSWRPRAIGARTGGWRYWRVTLKSRSVVGES